MIPFLITIDTEGDNVWARDAAVETRNARYLPRFQGLCERFGLKPVYLTNYEMAIDPVFVEFGRDILARRTAEIGMHLHAWNSPPLRPLTENDDLHHPYLIEYPQTAMREKVAYMTALLEDTFATKMRSHRAGRWAFNASYAALLRENGYVVDCSVTPHMDWRRNMGDPRRGGGTDYRGFPDSHYWLGETDIAKAGTSPLLEVPATVVNRAPAWLARAAGRLPFQAASRAVAKAWPLSWLRPNGKNIEDLKAILDRAVASRHPYVEFMIHSSEFMPGGSPYFPAASDIDSLYRDLEALFEHARGSFVGMTLDEFHAGVKSGHLPPGKH